MIDIVTQEPQAILSPKSQDMNFFSSKRKRVITRRNARPDSHNVIRTRHGVRSPRDGRLKIDQ